MMYTVTLPQILQPFDCQDLIRLGKDHDGGYLINSRDLSNTDQLVSFGLGQDFSFEKDFTDTNDCDVVVYDATVVSWDSDQVFDQYLDYFNNNRQHVKKNIGMHQDNVTCSQALAGTNIFLKCDIEGNEYHILDTVIAHSHKLTGLVIEFHNINNDSNFEQLLNFIGKIDLKLVHLHVNNWFYYRHFDDCIPDILELTFTASSNIVYRRDLTLPRSLDQPNNPMDKDFAIRFGISKS